MQLNLKNQTYDVLNSVVRYILPGLGTLYFALAAIWGLPYSEEVVGTIVALTTFLGIIVALARNGWVADGTLLVDETDPTHNSFGFDRDLLLEDLKDKQIVNLRVNKVHYTPSPEDDF